MYSPAIHGFDTGVGRSELTRMAHQHPQNLGPHTTPWASLASLGPVLDRVPLLKTTAKYMAREALYLRSSFKWKGLAQEPKLQLELGAGPRKGSNGWTTVDLNLGADVPWDLRRPLPLPDASVDTIYSSHMLEHIPYEDMLILIRECSRLLKPSGEFLVCVPDARVFIEAYMEERLAFERDTWWQPAAVDTNSWIDQLNYIAYMNEGHKYLFDEQGLLNTLRKGGFSDVQRRDFDPALDRELYRTQSVYAVARK